MAAKVSRREGNRKMKRAVLVSAILLTFSSGIAGKPTTGKQLFAICTAQSNTDGTLSPSNTFCFAYLAGVENTLVEQNAICATPPDAPSPKPIELVRDFAAYLKSDAADLNNSGAKLAMDYWTARNDGCSPQ
jgi:hypothetical protein